MGKLLIRALQLVIVLVLIGTSFLNVSVAYAAPGDCDGTPANDVITCSTSPTNPDDTVGLGLGDDTYVQDPGVVSDYVGGDSLEDGSPGVGNGGNDHITINGIVSSCVDGDNVDGDGGDDTIIINGEVHCEVAGDYADGDGGNDNIIINGEVYSDVAGDSVGLTGGNDTIRVAASGTVGGDVYGDFSGDHGGNDTITIDGSVGGDIYGDASGGDGGHDTIIINGTVAGNVYADGVSGAGGNDSVQLGANASVGGIIDGEDGFDTLIFKFLLQSQLNGLDPASGTLTFGGRTFSWANFESLLGTLLQDVQAQWELLFSGSGFMAVDTGEGLKIVRGENLIAFIPHFSLNSLSVGQAPLRFQADLEQSQGWYVTVVNLGPTSGHPYRDTFQVQIFSPADVFAVQFFFVER